MRKLYLIALLALFSVNISHAQRFTDELDRGIVAVNLNGQVFVSWRILPEEYYGTTYNLYKNGSLVQSGLTVSNWTGSGSTSDNFMVAAVVNGVEGEKSSPAKVWDRFGGNQAGTITFNLSPVIARNNQDMTHHYWPNDAIFADLDGDGQLEFIIKRINIWDAGQDYPTNNATEYDVWEAYDVDWEAGTANRLWWIDCGPNMVSGNSVENNLLAFDWDMDGKAEVVMRGADNMIFHHSDGTTETIGSANVNTRDDINHYANGAYTCTGNEYLIYFNGQTGVTYTVMEYPLKRLENGETSCAAAWDETTLGHPSSKYFFGAPYLDGRKPSIFLGRGIYMRHKMIALDVNPTTHTLTTRWEWHSTAHGMTPGSYWFGNGNHNYVIADVDEDGRDEIIYGNMVIDDNGKGLNSTGFGHGDAMHVNDFDPYRKGLEIYNCIEDDPAWGMSYRSGLTGEVYKHYVSGSDDGRALAGNFSNYIPGSVGKTNASNALCLSNDNFDSGFNLMFSFRVGGAEAQKINYRIYWDGDLCSEQFDGIGAHATEGRSAAVFKWNENNRNSDRIMDTYAITNNGTKNNPAFQGDIIGDWREEIFMRTSSGAQVTEDGTIYAVYDQMTIYTSAYPTAYPIYNLWGDHQYRQAMGTQMQCYNLPPNASFFLGEMEGITQAPPPLMNRGRIEVRNGGTISTSYDGEHVMLAEVGNAQIKVKEGANPKVFTDNAPWWVQGNNPSEAQGLADASTTIYTHTLTGAPFTGETMVVKQGGGTLVLPGDEQTYTGDTKVWAGTLQYDGKMTNSNVWLNRFATLSSTGGEFKNVIAEYGSEILPGGPTAKVEEVTIENLTLDFGARVVFDLNGKNVGDNDQIHVTDLTFETKTDAAWVNYGPKNLKPVFQFNTTEVLPGGRYPIGTYTNSPQYALLSDIIVEGIDANRNPSILVDGGTIYLELNSMNPTSEPEIAIVDMVRTDLTDLYPSSKATSYYMPKVGIVVEDVNGEQPVLMGTFTDMSGKVTDLGNTQQNVIMTVNYNDNPSGNVGGWMSQNYSDGLSLVEGDATYGKYIRYTCADQNSRTAYWQFGTLDMGNNPFVIEFDASIKPGNNQTTQLAVMAGQGLVANGIYDSNYLFSAVNGGANSTTYTINNGGTVIIPSGSWCHYRIEVYPQNSEAKWTITNGNASVGNGTYTLPSGTGTTPTGIHFLSGRYQSVLTFDNLSIKEISADLSTFTFTEPGTLRVTVKGDASTADNFKTFTVENPYVKLGDEDEVENYYVETFDGDAVPSQWISPSASGAFLIKEGYLNLDLTNLASQPQGSRSAYCNLSNGINISSDKYTIDFDATLRPGNKDGSALAQNQIALLAAGNLPANNAYATENLLFSAINKGQFSTQYTVSTSDNKEITIPSETWFNYHFIIDKTQRTIQWTITNKSSNAIIGEGTDDIPTGTGVDVKYIYMVLGRYNGAFSIDNINISSYSESNSGSGAILDFVPVSVHDELLTTLPNAVADGNAHIWRNGLNTTTTWASLVLPFDMTSDQITEVFGENTQVANLVTDMGNATQLYFETDSRTIHANQPVLIKDVSNPAPYLIMGISSNPVAVPIVQNAQFQYIGNYDNKGSMPFYHNVDYFFSNNKLSTVKTDGTYMTLKGYRGYFHANDGAEASISVIFDDPSGVRDLTTAAPKTFNVYSLSGQMIRRNATSLQGLTRGIYIVNGKKYLVK